MVVVVKTLQNFVLSATGFRDNVIFNRAFCVVFFRRFSGEKSKMEAAGPKKRLDALRKQMKAIGVNAYIVPTADPHQSEYISSADAQREWLSGFTGSAGTAVVTETKALLWTDGRYTLQAKQQLDADFWTLMDESVTTTPNRPDYLADALRNRGATVGLSASVVTHADYENLKDILARANVKLMAVDRELVHVARAELKEDAPALPCNPVRAISIDYTGRSISDKLSEVRTKMQEKGASALVVAALDSVAWLLNCRGSDIEYNPVFYSYLYITKDDIVFFDRAERMQQSTSAIVDAGLPRSELTTESYDNILPFLRTSSVALANDERDKPTVWIPHNYSEALHIAAAADGKVHILAKPSPVAILKITKNETEALGMRSCHVRDGAALVRFLHLLETSAEQSFSETSAAERLDRLRADEDAFVGPSFATISASGPNASVIHYKPKKNHDRVISTKEMYLVDSGGQYLDGTTDVTRTVHYGTPTDEERRSFTLVLKGQIALGRIVFPYGIKGNVLDVMARFPLWQNGLDYAHGTGHGVGHQLNVHEGPIGISWRAMPDDPGLGPNMFISNEPGFYSDNKYGIRIEDIIETVPARLPGSGPGPRLDGENGEINDFGGRGTLAFNTVTMAPIQLKLIDISMLNEEEINHVDSYHAKVFSLVGAHLKSKGFSEAADWLSKETVPLRQYYK